MQSIFRGKRSLRNKLDAGEVTPGARVLIVNQADLLNKGDQALLTATCELVRRALPEASIGVVTHTPHTDAPRCDWPTYETYRISYKRRSRRWRAEFPLTVARYIRGITSVPPLRPAWNFVAALLPSTVRAYAQSDLVIARGGDNWTEDYGFPRLYFDSVKVALRCGKPVMLLGETVGPFQDPAIRREALDLLGAMQAVVVRDPLSYEYLEGLGLKPPKLKLLPDVAFSLRPAEPAAVERMVEAEGLDAAEPIVAFSISALISRYAFTDCALDEQTRRYTAAMAAVADHCVARYGAKVVFLAHVMGEDNDDRHAAAAVRDRMEHAGAAVCIQGEYSHETYRGFLTRHATMTVASRMHVAIASASVGVPVVPLAYSVKTHGIFASMLRQQDLIVDVRQCASEDDLARSLVEKVDDGWARREEIHSQLTQRSKALAAQTDGYVELIRESLVPST